MALEALIFDFDGLILDSEQAAFQAWTEIYDRYAAKLPLEEWVECVGSSYSRFDPVTKLETLTGQSFDRQALLEEKNRRKELLCSTMQMMPGVVELIEVAKVASLKLAVASSSGREWVVPHLERLGLRKFFHDVTTREDVVKVKPAPDLYLRSAEKLAVEPARCLVFEDSFNGVVAAKAAGMRVIAVPGVITRGLDFRDADRRLESLLEFELQAFLTP